MFPDLQLHPNSSLETEIPFLNEMSINGARVPGISSILGDPSEKYWLVHRKRFGTDPSEFDHVETSGDRSKGVAGGSRVTVDIIMTGVCPDICNEFFKNSGISDSENEKAMVAVLKNVLPEFQEIQGKCFSPCG
jgi:hypothetical protein